MSNNRAHQVEFAVKQEEGRLKLFGYSVGDNLKWSTT